MDCMSPVKRRREVGFASPDVAQSIAKPSARPCELIVNAGLWDFDLSAVYPGTSRASMSGRISHMCTLPVSAQLATKYGCETGGNGCDAGNGCARTRFTPPKWGMDRYSRIGSSSKVSSSSSSSESESSLWAPVSVCYCADFPIVLTCIPLSLVQRTHLVHSDLVVFGNICLSTAH